LSAYYTLVLLNAVIFSISLKLDLGWEIKEPFTRVGTTF
jgi:hypothetical protein